MIRHSKRASSPAEIDDSMLNDRQDYLYQDKGADSCESIKTELLLSIKKAFCNIIKSRYGFRHIWQAAIQRGEREKGAGQER